MKQYEVHTSECCLVANLSECENVDVVVGRCSKVPEIWRLPKIQSILLSLISYRRIKNLDI